MIRKALGFLVVMAFMVSLVSIALARAPNKTTFIDQATAIAADMSPTVANVPPMTVGFDVIQNLSKPAYPRLASVNQYTDISAKTRQSTTVAEHGFMATGYCSARSGPRPDVVSLA